MHWMRQLATFFRNPATFSYRPALEWLLHLALRCFREEEAFDAIVEDKAAREEFRWQVRFAEVLLRGLIKEKAAEIIYYQVHPEEALPRAQRPDARPSDLKPRKRRPARLFPRLGPPRFHLRTPPLVASKPRVETPPPPSQLCRSPSRASTEPAPSPRGAGGGPGRGERPRRLETSPHPRPSPASEGGEKQGSGTTHNSSVLPREGEVASGSEPVGAPCQTPNAAPSAPAAPGQLPGEHGACSLPSRRGGRAGEGGAPATLGNKPPPPPLPRQRGRGEAGQRDDAQSFRPPPRGGGGERRRAGMMRRPTPNSPPRLMLRLIAVHNARKKLEKYAWRYAKAQARRKAKWAAMGGKGAPPLAKRVAAIIARITEPRSADPPAPAPWRAETAP